MAPLRVGGTFAPGLLPVNRTHRDVLMASFLSRLFREPPEAAPAQQLYLAAVAQARQPALYLGYGVPDTLDGRFDMTALHVFLLLYRLRTEGEGTRRLGQALFDYMFGDMDRSLRELGVGDLRVARKIKPMVEAFQGRAQAYREALQARDEAALAEALHRNVYRNEPTAHAPALAGYVRRQVDHLASQSAEAVSRGMVSFLAP